MCSSNNTRAGLSVARKRVAGLVVTSEVWVVGRWGGVGGFCFSCLVAFVAFGPCCLWALLHCCPRALLVCCFVAGIV